jgi:YD repeat-containing protein
MQATYDKNGYLLTFDSGEHQFFDILFHDLRGERHIFKAPARFKCEYTRDAEGRELSYRDNNGVVRHTTRNARGDIEYFKDAMGYSYEIEYDEHGNPLHYTNNKGVSLSYPSGTIVKKD